MVEQGQSDNGFNRTEAIRNWLKVCRDNSYAIIGTAAIHCSIVFFGNTSDAASLSLAILENLQSIDVHHMRLVVRAVIIPLVKSCPHQQWRWWLLPILPPVLTHLQNLLSNSWTLLLTGSSLAPSSRQQGGQGSNSLMKEEVLQEKLLRDLTRESCSLLSTIAAISTSVSTTPSSQSSGSLATSDASGEQQQQQSASSQANLLSFLFHHSDAGAAEATLRLGIGSITWPDSEAAHRAATFCTAVVSMLSMAPPPDQESQLMHIVSHDMFSAAIQGLTLDSNALLQAELVGILRDILVRLGSHTTAPRQILLSLPGFTTEKIAALDAALLKTGSEKEQRQAVKAALRDSGGEQLRALLSHKSPATIANISDRSLSLISAFQQRWQQEQTIKDDSMLGQGSSLDLHQLM
eukprot:TRINITY_DN5548_c0_g1_i1.p1 TRINITY_DN5548_c0_g1~~TRINITY_DN5548_c0_g1_i1.p1  ORF type:complete len:427 (-),score=79.47 TRINITY_DN5548_c0_g1_i1:123-1343(-)